MSGFNPLDLTGSAILITGASAGIGRAAAVYLSRLGARLAVSGRDAARLQHTVESLHGSGHVALVSDLAVQPVSVTVDAAFHALGRLAGAVHCAGLHELRPLKLQSRERINRLLEVNLIAALELAQALRKPSVRAERPSIVFLSSVMATVGQPGAAGYCASKAAIEGMTRSLALELAPERIRINAVAPAVVRTEMGERMFQSMNADQQAAVERAHPLGLGEPDDVAAAIAFLLSPASRWATGTILTIDGGYTAQ
ncbi:MAG TPA: SDR family oxidoreductase [Bryobacteraceae bacterium]|nr:SDR family oxidoreductase [Bryobacteraceae bacterium]